MSEIRKLLAAAQAAETRGDPAEAVLRLREAAAWYRERQLLSRAAKLLRHARRVEGLPEADDDVFGFGADFEPGAAAPSPVEDEQDEAEQPSLAGRLMEQRGPQLADPALDAWCSFCCRPRAEVGPLVAGPAGAFVCAACARACAALLGAPGEVLAPSPPPASAHPPVELPAQRRARERLARQRPRVALVVGPEGAGKTAWLKTLGAPVEPPLPPLAGDTVLVDLTRPLSPEDEARLTHWLEAHPHRRAVLSARGEVPTPVLVLQGEAGEEPIFDTAALGRAVRHASPALLSKVDAVLPLESPDRQALREFAHALLARKGATVPEAAVEQVVSLAEQSGRGAHEVMALVSRIPPGRYVR